MNGWRSAIGCLAARSGLAVAVVEPAPGSGASHVAAGMLAPVTEVTYTEEALRHQLGDDVELIVLAQPESAEPGSGQTVAANRLEVTILRGREISALARAEAVAFLNAESASGIAWVRQQVMPALIDDLAADPKIRELALGQAQGAFADAARELRQRSAVADGWVEAGVRRLLGRHEPAPTPTPSQPADG